MFELQDIVSRFGDDFKASNAVSYEGLKALKAIKECRTSALGGHIDAMEFIRRFLLHVLPSGFQKIRHYGILSNRNRKVKIAMCRRLTSMPEIKEKVKLTARELILKLKGIDISICRHCGGNIKRIASFLPSTG